MNWSNDEMLPYIKSLATKIIAYKKALALLYITVSIALEIIGICFIKWDISQIVGICSIETLIACKTFPERVIIAYMSTLYNKLIDNE